MNSQTPQFGSSRSSRFASEKVVLLAGLLCDASIWKPQGDALSERSDVLIYHFPAHDTITEMARDVLETAEGPLVVVGHSMGGRVALEIVRLAPERVRALALLNTGVHPVREGEAEKRQELVDLARAHGMRALAERWLPPMVAASRRQDGDLMDGLTAMVCRSDVAAFERQVGALLRRPDARRHLEEIRCPTLLASGTLDAWSPLAQHEEMNAAIAGSRLVPIIGSGHMSPAEHPVAVTDVLLALLDLPRP